MQSCWRTMSLSRLWMSLGLACSVTAAQTALQPILRIEPATLSQGAVKAGAADHPAQPLMLMPLARGTFIDGTSRTPWLMGPQLAANAADPAALGDAAVGSVRLATGEYSPQSVDLSLPCPGPAWPIGRSRTPLGGEPNSVMGPGWYQDSQPQMVFDDLPGAASDRVRLIYGGDRYAEFTRVMAFGNVSTNIFRGVNGAAGAFTSENTAILVPGNAKPLAVTLWTYFDATGHRAIFFGAEAVVPGHHAAWQLWKITDAGGYASCAGTSLGGVNAAEQAGIALVTGYDARGRLTAATDSAGRVYTYLHGVVDGRFDRLLAVRVTHPATGVRELASVEYQYLTQRERADLGPTGDLARVRVTVPASALSSPPIVQSTVYRTWSTQSLTSIEGFARGPEHSVRLVVPPEGVRRAGEAMLATGTDAQLAPYAQQRFGYDASGRVNAMQSDGLIDRTVRLDYALPPVKVPSTNGYDRAWAWRATSHVFVPSGRNSTPGELRAAVTYFDETGQMLSSVVLVPSSNGPSAPLTWASVVERDAAGRVVRLGTPASVAGYNATAGAFTAKDGPVRLFDRLTAAESVSLEGFVVRHKHATRVQDAGTLDLTLQYASSVDDAATRLDLGGRYSVLRPLIVASTTYPRAQDTQGLTTRYEHHRFAQATHTNELALRLEWIRVIHPAVSAEEHGSGLPTFSAMAMTPNGAVTHVRARGDAYAKLSGSTYLLPGTIAAGVIPTGQIAATYDDAVAGTGGLPSAPDGFPSGNARPHPRVTRLERDLLGRITREELPDGTATLAASSTLADGRIATIIARQTATGEVVSPAELGVMNLAGAGELSGTIAFGPRLPGWNQLSTVRSLPETWIDASSTDAMHCLNASALPGGEIRQIRTQLFDASGVRPRQSRVYHTLPDLAAGDDPEGKADLHFDATEYDFDAMGRLSSTTDPSRTIDTLTYDAIDRVIAVARGVEGGEQFRTAELVYDGGLSGGNSLISESRRFVDASGTAPRTVKYFYDDRSRLKAVANPVPPHVVVQRDRAGRAVVAGMFGGSQEGFVSMLSTFEQPMQPHVARLGVRVDRFDATGQLFHRDDTMGSGLDRIEPATQNLPTDVWYDAQGRVAMVHGSSTRKYAYDDLCGCGSSASWTCIVPALQGGLGSFPYAASMGIQPGDVVLGMDLAARDPATGRLRASTHLERMPQITRSGCDVTGDPDMLRLADEGLVNVDYSRVCGMRADTQVFSEDAIGRSTGSFRIGDTRLAGGFANPTPLAFDPDEFIPPSLHGGRIGTPIAPFTAQGSFTSFNNLGEAEKIEDERGDTHVEETDDAGRAISTSDKLGTAFNSMRVGICETPTPIDGTHGDGDSDGDQTHYRYERGRLREICGGVRCDNQHPDAPDGQTDAGKSLVIDYPDTSTTPPPVICAGSTCLFDPLNDNNLPKRQTLPGSTLPGTSVPVPGDVFELRHNLAGELIGRRDASGTVAMISRDRGGRGTGVAFDYPSGADATGLPLIDASVRSIGVTLDDRGQIRGTSLSLDRPGESSPLTTTSTMERDAWGKITRYATMPTMPSSNAQGGVTMPAMQASLAATLGTDYQRTWVDGTRPGEGAAWRGSRLTGMRLPGSAPQSAGLPAIPELRMGLDGRPMPQPELGTIGTYTGAVGMIAFPPDGRGTEAGGLPEPLIQYGNDGIAWPNEIDLTQAGYEKEQFREFGMAVVPAPTPEFATGLNQFGSPSIDRWHEVCGGVNCGPAIDDAANAIHDERVQDPPPQDVCACGIYTEDDVDPTESKKEEIICSGLVQTTTGPDASRVMEGNLLPPDLKRVTQYTIRGTDITGFKDLRSSDHGRTFEAAAQWTRSYSTANQAISGLDRQVEGGVATTVAVMPRYDTRGNLRDEGVATFADGRRGRIFEYDVFNNLTGVYVRNADGTAGVILAKFTYDASGHRSSATYNANVLEGTDPSDSTLANDSTDLYVYDAQWRVRAVLRREAGDSNDPSVRTWVLERWVYHQNGDGESAFGSGPSGDDAPAARFIDADGDGTFETVQHFICNRRGDVVAVVGPGIDGEPNDGRTAATIPGEVIARIWYDDYGLPHAIAPTDLDHDGDSDADDLAEYQHRFEIAANLHDVDPAKRRAAERYRNQIDWDHDGEVTAADGHAFVQSLMEAAEHPFDAKLELGNLPLYGGYWWDASLELYHVRHRVYDPRLGRWLQRDPMGYAAGSNLYAYVLNQPGRYVDPLGLWFESIATRLATSDSVVEQALGWGLGIAGAAAEGEHDGWTMIADHAVGWASSDVHSAAEEIRTRNAGVEGYAAGDAAGAIGVEVLIIAGTGALGEVAGCGTLLGEAAEATLQVTSLVNKVQTARAISEAAWEASNGHWDKAIDLAEDAAINFGLSYLMGKAAGAIACFEEGTEVSTPDGLAPIEELQVGDRVREVRQADDEQQATNLLESSIDPSTWRVYVVELSDETGQAGAATRKGTLELLKSRRWLQEAFAGTDAAGNAWVWLEIEEWGLQGTAKLVGVKPCPKVSPGEGRLVLMRSVTEYSGPIATVTFTDEAGQQEAITGTYGHPVYSLDRCGYVDLGSLEPQERVRTADGWATAESMARWWGREVVHNLEADGEHRYAVGRTGVVGHNSSVARGGGGCVSRRGNGGRGGGIDHARVQQDLYTRVGGTQERGIAGSGRVVDLEDAQGRLHQIGDMRYRSGLRPSARERGAIEDLRRVAPDATIIFHDKFGKLPSLINPDLQPSWRPAPSRYRKTL